jgi:putative membrane protein
MGARHDGQTRLGDYKQRSSSPHKAHRKRLRLQHLEDIVLMTAPPTQDENRTPLATKLLGGGTEPDPRFTLANERTFLAWIRTSLALLAGGIAVEAFTADVFPGQIRTLLAVVLLLLGVLLSAGSAVRWFRVERSLRRKAPLPIPLIVPLLGAGGAIVSGALIAFIIRN